MGGSKATGGTGDVAMGGMGNCDGGGYATAALGASLVGIAFRRWCVRLQMLAVTPVSAIIVSFYHK